MLWTEEPLPEHHTHTNEWHHYKYSRNDGAVKKKTILNRIQLFISQLPKHLYFSHMTIAIQMFKMFFFSLAEFI